MRPVLAPFLLLMVAGCLVGGPKAPEPLIFRSSQPPREVVRRAALALVSAGFQVTQIDSLGGGLVANRTRAANGNEEFVTCQLPRNSEGAANRATTLRIAFTATKADAGSDLRIESNVVTSYPGYDGTPMAMATNENDCASNGTMERRLADALR
jgi:hypothetical protein